MGIVKDVWVSGKLGPQVFYRVGDKQIVRSLPKAYERTEAMKARNQNFAIASAVSKYFRVSLAPVIPDPKDRKMQTSFAGAFGKWLQRTSLVELPSSEDVTGLSGFVLKPGGAAWENYLGSISASFDDEEARILIPPIPAQIRAQLPSAIEKVTLKISGTQTSLAARTYEEPFYRDFVYPAPIVEASPEEILLPISINPGHILIIIAAVEFKYKDSYGSKPKQDPVSRIVKAAYRKL